ncbi:MAG: VCBS repeat-containing protein, partial [Myxococcales bacterium]|nr:VCBS repeat-containing protein [Myxococcales bacterium]
MIAPTVANAEPAWVGDPNMALPDDPMLQAHRVQLADLNNDGHADILFANSAAVDSPTAPGKAQLNQLMWNDGNTGFTADVMVFTLPDDVTVLRTGDLNGDGNLDIVGGASWGGSSYILLGDGVGGFSPGPAFDTTARVGDLELGDIDGDGDLDVVLTDFGTKQLLGGFDDPGGPVELWLNQGDGTLVNAADLGWTIPGLLMGWSNDVSFIDIDNDYDLDILVMSRGGGADDIMDFPRGRLYVKDDGLDSFSYMDQAALPQAKYCPGAAYSDFNRDPNDPWGGDLLVDFFTLQLGGSVMDPARRNRVLTNDPLAPGSLVVAPGFLTAPADAIGLDMVAAYLDHNNDGRADVLLGGRQINPVNAARLLYNEDSAAFDLELEDPLPLDAGITDIFDMQLADLNGDNKVDVVIAQQGGQGLLNQLLLANDATPADTSPPVIGHYEIVGEAIKGGTLSLRCRADDYKNPVALHDWWWDEGDGDYWEPWVEYAEDVDVNEFLALDDADKIRQYTEWYGEARWIATIVQLPFADTFVYRFCARDRAGNQTCTPPVPVELKDPICGNDIIEGMEECDPPDGDTCIDCFVCGNGICSYPSENNDNCSEDCSCGDGVVDEDNEECDDPDDPKCIDCFQCGNGVCSYPSENNQNCSEDCFCGDGVVDQANEECDDNSADCVQCMICPGGDC